MRQLPYKLLTVAITLAGILTFAISAPASAATAALSVSPAAKDFGQTPIGVPSSAASFTVTNTGTDASGAVTVVLGGINSHDFTIDSNTCAGPLAGGASCSVTVHFAPAALGARSAALKISANPGGAHPVTLSGTGVSTLNASPASYAFPNQNVGTTSSSAGFTVTNDGLVPLSSGSVSPTDAADFPVTGDTCAGATLPPGGTCTISVDFNAAVLGAHTSTVHISFNDPGNLSHQASFTVSGTSIVPPPDLSTTARVASENFSNASVTITVTNLGGTASVPATMTIDADPTQNFSYEAGAGTDCTAQSVNNFGVFGSRFTCPVPGGIAPGGTYTRTLTIQNLSGQAPHYVQCDATTIMPGDASSSNNTGYATVIFG